MGLFLFLAVMTLEQVAIPFMWRKECSLYSPGGAYVSPRSPSSQMVLFSYARVQSKAVGLEPGEYKVRHRMRSNFDDFDRPPVKHLFIPKYGARAGTTDLTATVKEESNVFEFTLDPFEGAVRTRFLTSTV